MVVGVASEAGIWRQPWRNGLYRQTVVSGLHPKDAAAPLEVAVSVAFDDEDAPQTRTLHVTPGERWSLNLDDTRSPLPTYANAVVTLRASSACAAVVTLWHAPRSVGVLPVIYVVPFVYMEEPIL